MEPISGSLSLLLPLISQIAGKGSYGANQGGMSPDTALNPLFGGLQLPGVAMQGILGIKQLFDARKLERSTRRPTYTIPGAQQESLALARANAYGPSPGLNVAQAAMGRGLAGGMSSALQSGGPEGLAAAAMMAQGNSDQSMNLAAQQEQWRAQQMGNVLSALNRQAEYQDVGWRKNYEEPFLQASEKAAQLRDAGYTNTQDFLYGAGGTIASMAKDGWMGGKGKTGATGASARTGMMSSGIPSLGGGGVSGTKPMSPFDQGELPSEWNGLRCCHQRPRQSHTRPIRADQREWDGLFVE